MWGNTLAMGTGVVSDLSSGIDLPHIVQACIEITPFDFVKFEIDNITDYIWVDRSQKLPAQPAVLNGITAHIHC